MKECPVCKRGEWRTLHRLERCPVLCNLLFDCREAAENALAAEIELVQCDYCTHVFNTLFDADRITYSRGYNASLSSSPSYREYAESMAERLISLYDLRKKHVVEIGCGSGEFAELLISKGRCSVKGYDPAAETTLSGPTLAIEAGPFAPAAFAHRVACVVSRHVLEHLAEPRSMLEHICRVVEGGSVVHLEVPNGEFILEDISIWDIIYEHVSCFTSLSLQYLLETTGFEVLDLSRRFGDQYMTVDARKLTENTASHGGVSGKERNRILALGRAFTAGVGIKVGNTVKLIEETRRKGTNVVVWGAGSKGVSLVNQLSCTDSIQYVVDSCDEKQGKYVPGTGHAILSPAELAGKGSYLVLIVNSLYRQEIRRQLIDLDMEPTLEVVQ